MAAGPEKRGLLKPTLQWKGTPPPAPKASAPAPVRPQPAPAAKVLRVPPPPKGLPANAVSQSQYTLDQVKKMAASRGISVEKMLAQMVQQYLKEDGTDLENP